MKKYKTIALIDGETVRSREFRLWTGMKTRVLQKKSAAYLDCTISDNFMNFQYFAAWCQQQKGWNEDQWHLDKDFIVDGNREYHEDKCVFVPRIINVVLTNEKKPRTNGLPLGVIYDKKWNQYRAHCGVYGNIEYLGVYRNAQDAHKAYVDRKNEYVQELASTYKGRVRDEVYLKLLNFRAE